MNKLNKLSNNFISIFLIAATMLMIPSCKNAEESLSKKLEKYEEETGALNYKPKSIDSIKISLHPSYQYIGDSNIHEDYGDNSSILVFSSDSTDINEEVIALDKIIGKDNNKLNYLSKEKQESISIGMNLVSVYKSLGFPCYSNFWSIDKEESLGVIPIKELHFIYQTDEEKVFEICFSQTVEVKMRLLPTTSAPRTVNEYSGFTVKEINVLTFDELKAKYDANPIESRFVNNDV